jgi:hypothetical protein
MLQSRESIQKIIDQHQQISNNSCIPSAVEMILKLLEKAPLDYYELQNAWTIDGSFANFDGQTIRGVTFRRTNLADRGADFPLDQLFGIIDQELAAGRYVIIALFGMSDSGPRFHAYVIFDIDQITQDYLAVTRASLNGTYVTQFDTNIKARIREIQGTDILVYTVQT